MKKKVLNAVRQGSANFVYPREACWWTVLPSMPLLRFYVDSRHGPSRPRREYQTLEYRDQNFFVNIEEVNEKCMYDITIQNRDIGVSIQRRDTRLYIICFSVSQGCGVKSRKSESHVFG